MNEIPTKFWVTGARTAEPRKKEKPDSAAQANSIIHGDSFLHELTFLSLFLFCICFLRLIREDWREKWIWCFLGSFRSVSVARRWAVNLTPFLGAWITTISTKVHLWPYTLDEMSIIPQIFWFCLPKLKHPMEAGRKNPYSKIGSSFRMRKK